ncbi:cytochrome P450 [Nonomuraea gerenzanensis]|uniref:Putative cytochrome P450 hydroxylase n=1 Tax=Nonomuraea gerenzanensis TaxID=93944 RepID=A0A1M4EAU8_9ACTN|nr:cytochrome P450 [Nonomuraea gerenzanensis]UBU17927.1 cytochrome P450 [Nonomuraea gerenzanensis]SBO95723.1 putative cytochrome P450 hydroxylase [Nonomuraea gerenzanensis]
MTVEQAPHYPFANPGALEPPHEWAELRDGCPIAPVRLASGDRALLLTRYDDVKQVLSDPRFTRQLDAPDAARVTANESGGVFGSGGSSMSGEEHRAWRQLVGKAFTAKRVMAMQPRIEAMAVRLVEGMVAEGAPADLVSAVGFPLPVWAICDLLGVPDSDREKFAYWSDTMLSMTRYAQEEIDAAQAEFDGYLVALVEGKKAAPGDDLISELLAMVEGLDGRLTEQLMLGTAKGLLVAGHETTANMIGKMVSMLLADRGRWEALLADRALIRPAVEEALRFDANPGFGMPRYLSEEVEVGGERLPGGTTVICSMASANRDERQFEQAGEMRLDRSPNPHVAFGAGPHSCIGQSLARTELQTVLKVLLDELPTLELAVPAGELRRREGLIVGGLERVPVRW